MKYIPTRDANRISWLFNMKEKIAATGAILGLEPNEITVLQQRMTVMIEKIQAAERTWTDYKEAITAKKAMETKELKLLRTDIAAWKTAKGYSPGIGAALGIVGEKNAFDATHYKARLSVSVMGDFIRLRFKKLGADSVNIYKRKSGTMQWIFVARDINSPYDDHIELAIPGQPEHWEYTAYGVRKDEQFGAPANIVQIVYGAIA